MNDRLSVAHLVQLLALGSTIVLLCGCASTNKHYFQAHPVDPQKVVFVTSEPSFERPRELHMFTAHDGRPLSWDDFINAVAWADVVIVGEQHDDAIGHAFQRVLVEDICNRWPDSTLTMEMLERDDQPLIDDYAEGIIDASTFATLTHSKGWGGKTDSWAQWYQPIVDAALWRTSKKGVRGMNVVGANAPRRYVRLARTEGYQRLEQLPKNRRALLDLPQGGPPAQYWQRFQDVMNEASDSDDAKTQAGHGSEMTQERLVNGFRSQRVWDATMAASIARAKKSGADKIVHLVGQFHSDFEGGTTHEVRQRLPNANLLTISMQRADGATMRQEDRNRADVVVYTGERKEEDQPAESATQPESQTTDPAAPGTQPAVGDEATSRPSAAQPEA
jgi:uncharacterized iron-regulated protein